MNRADKWKKRLGILLLVTTCGSILCACMVEETSGTKISDITYTIVEDGDVPEELKKAIEEKKTADFKLTYEVNDELYIIRGYGEQETGGYSIRIKDCYLTANAILFDTELVGPRKGETTSTSPSYPYIVIKTGNCDKSTVFE